jgi:ribosome-binding protein aMBF1 (putative translation factor)
MKRADTIICQMCGKNIAVKKVTNGDFNVCEACHRVFIVKMATCSPLKPAIIILRE